MKDTQNLIVMGIAFFLIKLQFWFPIWVIFLLDKGLSLQQIVIADIVYWFSIIIFEFPTGILGDKIGRKQTFFISALLAAVSYYLMTQIDSFGFLLLTWVVWGIFMATLSGTDIAMIYELIMASKYRDIPHHILGYFNTIQSAAFIFSTLIAGYLYAISSNIPIYVNSIVALASAILILFVPETKKKSAIIFRDNVNKIIDMFKTIPAHRFIVLLTALLYSYSYAATILFQPLLESFNIPVSDFGLIFASFPIFAVIGGIFTGKASDKVGKRKYVTSIAILLVLSIFLIGIGSTWISISGIVLMYLFFALINPILLAELNKRIEDNYRSSTISFTNLVSSFGLAFARPGITLIATATSLQMSYIIWGGLGVLLLLIFGYILYKNNDYIK